MQMYIISFTRHTELKEKTFLPLLKNERLMHTFCGSPSYCAPECLSMSEYDGRLSDIWSLGVILYSMVTGEHPWTVQNTSLMHKQIMKAEYTIPEYISDECRDLIAGLLQAKPSDRMQMKEIINHPWLTFSEWALAKEPAGLGLSLSRLSLLEKEPVSPTIEQISSSSSRSSVPSEHGIVSPFADEEDEEIERETRLPLAQFTSISLPHIAVGQSLKSRSSTKLVFGRRTTQLARHSRAKIWIPTLAPTSLMSVIKEREEEM